MILLAVACVVIGAGVAKAMSAAGMELSLPVALGIAAATAIVFMIGEVMRRSSEFSSGAIVAGFGGSAVGVATAVGWLDPLADALEVSPMWGHAVAGGIWLVALGGPLLEWWD